MQCFSDVTSENPERTTVEFDDTLTMDTKTSVSDVQDS